MKQEVLDEFRANNGVFNSLPVQVSLDSHGRIPNLDKQLGEPEWRRVYEAYAKTAIDAELAGATGLPISAVRYLVSYGIRRLGLPPIREAAVDYTEVNLRLRKLTEVDVNGPRKRKQYLTHLAEAREAATERTAKECAATQGTLQATLHTADAFLGYVNQVLEKTQTPDGYDIPKQITAPLLERLAKTASSLARAVDTAVRLSRFTAGEPERNITFEVAALIGRMSEEDLRSYLQTGAIPHHLRIIGSNFIDADFERVEAPVPPPPLPDSDE